MVNGSNVLVLPRGIQNEIIKKSHDKGHFGIKKLEELLSRDYYIPDLRRKIERCIQNCIPCILGSRKARKQDGFLHPISKGEVPLDTFHLDHIGPMHQTKKSYNYILAVTDGFSKFVWLYPTKSTGVEEVISKLIINEAVFGSPNRFICDKGSAFRANNFAEYCEKHNVEKVLITTGVPRGNSQIERQNHIIKTTLTKLAVEKPEDWYRYKNRVQQAMNSSYQRSIKSTPFEILVGVTMKRASDADVQEIIQDEIRELFIEERTNSRTTAKNNILKIQVENRMSFNKGRKESLKYTEGDVVAIKRTQFKNGVKLHSIFLGAYKITKIRINDRYDVEKIGEQEGPKLTSTSADLMKPWSDGWISSETDDEF